MIHHLEDQLSAYMDDELSIEEKLAVDKHLESCESCQALLDEMLALQTQVIDVFHIKQAPLDFELNVKQKIEQHQPLTIGKRWLALPLIAILLVGLFGITAGAMFVKFFHGFTRLVIAVLYMGMHFTSSVPLLYFTVIVLAVLILLASIYSLRRALQFTSMERG